MKKLFLFICLFLGSSSLAFASSAPPYLYKFIINNYTPYQGGVLGKEQSLFFFPNKLLLAANSSTNLAAKSINSYHAIGDLLMQFAAMGQCDISYYQYPLQYPATITPTYSGRIYCSAKANAAPGLQNEVTINVCPIDNTEKCK